MAEDKIKELFIIQENAKLLVIKARERIKKLAYQMKYYENFKYLTLKEVESIPLKRQILNTTYYDSQNKKFKVLRDIWNSRKLPKVNFKGYVNKHYNQANNRIRIPEAEFLNFLYDSNITDEDLTSKYAGCIVKVLNAEETIKAYRDIRSCMTNQLGILAYINEEWVKVYGLLKGTKILARAVAIQDKIVRIYSPSAGYQEIFKEIMKESFPEVKPRGKDSFFEYLKKKSFFSIIDYNEKIKNNPDLKKKILSLYKDREIPYDDSGAVTYRIVKRNNNIFVLAKNSGPIVSLFENPKHLRELFYEEKYGKPKLLQKKSRGRFTQQRIIFEKSGLDFEL